MSTNKIWNSFDEAVSDIPNGATIMVFAWALASAGTPYNLIRALRDHGAKDLTIISHNFHMARIPDLIGPLALIDQAKKVITTWSGSYGDKESLLSQKVKRREIELELTSHGTLVERIRAGGVGIGGFYTRAGIGTILEKGKETKIIDGEKYMLETPLKADFSLVRAHKADKWGNLTYRGTARGSNPVIALASRITIVEVDEIVEVGGLDPENIITPGLFVHRIVAVPEGGLGSYSQRPSLIRKIFEKEQGV